MLGQVESMSLFGVELDSCCVLGEGSGREARAESGLQLDLQCVCDVQPKAAVHLIAGPQPTLPQAGGAGARGGGRALRRRGLHAAPAYAAAAARQVAQGALPAGDIPGGCGQHPPRRRVLAGLDWARAKAGVWTRLGSAQVYDTRVISARMPPASRGCSALFTRRVCR